MHGSDLIFIYVPIHAIVRLAAQFLCRAQLKVNYTTADYKKSAKPHILEVLCHSEWLFYFWHYSIYIFRTVYFMYRTCTGFCWNISLFMHWKICFWQFLLLNFDKMYLCLLKFASLLQFEIPMMISDVKAYKIIGWQASCFN